MSSREGTQSESDNRPFRLSVREGVVLLDDIRPEIRRHYVGLERELPVVREAVAAFVEAGQRRFVFDLRTAELDTAYPVAKWGAMYGAFARLRSRHPDAPGRELARGIVLIGSGLVLEEIRLYRLDLVFRCVETLEDALAAEGASDDGE